MLSRDSRCRWVAPPFSSFWWVFSQESHLVSRGRNRENLVVGEKKRKKKKRKTFLKRKSSRKGNYSRHRWLLLGLQKIPSQTEIALFGSFSFGEIFPISRHFCFFFFSFSHPLQRRPCNLVVIVTAFLRGGGCSLIPPLLFPLLSRIIA